MNHRRHIQRDELREGQPAHDSESKGRRDSPPAQPIAMEPSPSNAAIVVIMIGRNRTLHAR